jgi:hypothetical protein
MTDASQIKSNPRYRSLKKVMDRSENLDDFDQRVGGASASQIRLFNDYKKLQEEQVAQRVKVQREGFGRYRKIVVKGKTRYVLRDKKGRFVKFKERRRKG